MVSLSRCGVGGGGGWERREGVVGQARHRDIVTGSGVGLVRRSAAPSMLKCVSRPPLEVKALPPLRSCEAHAASRVPASHVLSTVPPSHLRGRIWKVEVGELTAAVSQQRWRQADHSRWENRLQGCNLETAPKTFITRVIGRIYCAAVLP